MSTNTFLAQQKQSIAIVILSNRHTDDDDNMVMTLSCFHHRRALELFLVYIFYCMLYSRGLVEYSVSPRDYQIITDTAFAQ
jgi:hypothetical protein